MVPLKYLNIGLLPIFEEILTVTQVFVQID